MKDRIEKIIIDEGITSSKFADEIGIQRSSISHILSGRNNPSLDVFQRILRKYPNINSDWLILGIGDMYKEIKIGEQKTIFSNLDNTKPIITKETIIPVNEKNAEPEKAVIDDTNTVSAETNKAIDKIIIFYKDKTFEVYN